MIFQCYLIQFFVDRPDSYNMIDIWHEGSNDTYITENNNPQGSISINIDHAIINNILIFFNVDHDRSYFAPLDLCKLYR